MSDGTIFFDSGPGPGTHALVVGVGHYPHLPGGGGTPVRANTGLLQLPGAAESARAMANWLVGAHGPRLKSLSLLLSERSPSEFTYGDGGRPASDPRTNDSVAAATYANLELAARVWTQRAASDRGNQTLFFFSGHGVGLGTAVGLLLADFGSTDQLDGMLDLDRFRLGMRHCEARHQLYFIDACRTAPAAMGPAAEGYMGESPLRPGFNQPAAPLVNPVFYATVAGAPAWARSKGLTLFGQALLGALGGGGAMDLHADGQWHIVPGTLSQALSPVLDAAAGQYGRLQLSVADGLSRDFSIHELGQPPVIPFVVDMEPPSALAHAKLSCATDTGAIVEERNPDPHPWLLQAPSGTYTLSVRFANQRFPDKDQPLRLTPPTRRVIVRV